MGARQAAPRPLQQAQQVSDEVAAQVQKLARRPGGATAIVHALKDVLPRGTTVARIAAVGMALMLAGNMSGAVRQRTFTGLDSIVRAGVNSCPLGSSRDSCLAAAHRWTNYGATAVDNTPANRWAENPYGQQGKKAARHHQLRNWHAGTYQPRKETDHSQHQFYSGVRLGDLNIHVKPVEGEDIVCRPSIWGDDGCHLKPLEGHPGAGVTERPLTVYRGTEGIPLQHVFEHGLPAPYWRGRHPTIPFNDFPPHPNSDLSHHVLAGFTRGQVYASTSMDPKVADAFAGETQPNETSAIYEIDLPAGKGLYTKFHTNKDVSKQQQVSVPGGVPGNRIRRAWRKLDIDKFVNQNIRILRGMSADDPGRAQIQERTDNPIRYVPAIDNPAYES
jgi:hypothetical protein